MSTFDFQAVLKLLMDLFPKLGRELNPARTISVALSRVISPTNGTTSRPSLLATSQVFSQSSHHLPSTNTSKTMSFFVALYPPPD